MRLLAFSGRNVKEILRDPMTLGFGIAFPLLLLFLLSAIQANIPVSMFEIANLTPGISVFGLSFLTLFASLLVARDRESAFLQRLYTAPMTGWDFIGGYLLPMLPIAAAQSLVCCLAAIPLGLTPDIKILFVVLLNLPMALFHIGLGLLLGSVLGVKQVGGIVGALLTNVSAWLSGTWFDLSLVGGAFEKIANLLPFVHGVDLGKAVMAGNYGGIFPHIYWVLGYAAAATAGAVVLFLRQMKRQ